MRNLTLLFLFSTFLSIQSQACEYGADYSVSYPELEKITMDADFIVIGKNYEDTDYDIEEDGFVKIFVSKVYKGEVDSSKDYIIVSKHKDMCHYQYFSSSYPMLLFLEKDYYSHSQFGDSVVYKPKYAGSSHSSFEILEDENGSGYIFTNPDTFKITSMESFEKMLSKNSD